MARTARRPRGSPTPTATGSSWCSSHPGIPTGSPQRTLAEQRTAGSEINHAPRAAVAAGRVREPTPRHPQASPARIGKHPVPRPDLIQPSWTICASDPPQAARLSATPTRRSGTSGSVRHLTRRDQSKKWQARASPPIWAAASSDSSSPSSVLIWLICESCSPCAWPVRTLGSG